MSDVPYIEEEEVPVCFKEKGRGRERREEEKSDKGANLCHAATGNRRDIPDNLHQCVAGCRTWPDVSMQ